MRKDKSGLNTGATTGSDVSAMNGSIVVEEQKHGLVSMTPSLSEQASPDLSREETSATAALEPQSQDILPKAQPPASRSTSQDRRNEKEERELLSSIPKPRVRYDVEVITKLIVYSGNALMGYVVFRTDCCRNRMAQC